MHRSFYLGTLFLLSCSYPENDEQKLRRYQGMGYQEMVEDIKTPEEAGWYIEHYIAKEENASLEAYTFRETHERRKGDCSEAIVAAAALLSDDGYPLYALFFRSPLDVEKFPRHVVFVYQENQKWGSLGLNVIDRQKPVFSTLEELAAQFPFKEYAFETLPVDNFPHWISGSGNLNVRKKFFGLSPLFHEIER